MPRFSVIVPMYNVEAYIGECIDSLQRQSFADFEAVCVDDGSTDNTLSVAKAAAAGDGRFVFVERPNGGLSAARNTGLAAATGEYVSFLDSDDRYATCALERMNALLSANDLDLLDFSASTFYDSAEAHRAHEESYDYREDVPGMMSSAQELFVEYWMKLQFVSSACFRRVAARRRTLHAAALCFGRPFGVSERAAVRTADSRGVDHDETAYDAQRVVARGHRPDASCLVARKRRSRKRRLCRVVCHRHRIRP